MMNKEPSIDEKLKVIDLADQRYIEGVIDGILRKSKPSKENEQSVTAPQAS